jgi:uncharacterized protein
MQIVYTKNGRFRTGEGSHQSVEAWRIAGPLVDLEVIAIVRDDRFDYGEPRYRAYGVIDGVSHCLVFTVRNGRYRPISLRRAHAKEMRRHAPKS